MNRYTLRKKLADNPTWDFAQKDNWCFVEDTVDLKEVVVCHSQEEAQKYFHQELDNFIDKYFINEKDFEESCDVNYDETVQKCDFTHEEGESYIKDFSEEELRSARQEGYSIIWL